MLLASAIGRLLLLLLHHITLHSPHHAPPDEAAVSLQKQDAHQGEQRSARQELGQMRCWACAVIMLSGVHSAAAME
jgi:hypothetical protein